MRLSRGIAPIVTAVFVIAAPVWAQQTSPPAADDEPKARSGFKGAAASIAGAFDQPLHPIIAGVVASGGVGAGVAYQFPLEGRWQGSASALMTVRQYWSAEVGTSYERNRARVEGYARIRDMRRLNFFGLGNDAARGSRTNFRLNDPVVGGLVTVDVAPGVAVGGRVEALWPEVSSGRGTVPSIEQRFAEVDAPGLTTQPRFARYQSFIEATVPADTAWRLNQGGTYRATYDVFDDRERGRFDFRRLELEGRHKLAMRHRYHSLTLHAWLSAASTTQGNEVPFFLQHTLGGSGNLRSVHEAPIGTDGSRATLRGFRSYRFRDRNLLLLQAEYRWDVWGPLEATAFVDAGKVAGRRADLLNLSDLKRNFGFSLSLMRKLNAVARIDVGFGGGEGAHVILTALR
jgi:hypothetical protein